MTSNDQQEDYDDINNDIAIIGMAGRFPMAENIDQFWTNLVSSQDCIRRFSMDELEKMGVSAAALADPHFVPVAGYIDDQERFDAHFFEMNPREAANLDPQHRFALEVAWQTLEHAGYTPESVNGSIGVFGGVNISTYFICNLMQNDGVNVSADALGMLISIDKDMFASRISYKLNLNGPSIALGTACSTSLVCIHLACQSLLNGESKMALAGGSHITTPNTVGHVYQEGGYSSRDDACRAFDAKGSGTIGGAGTCFVLLKRMDDALADNDTIYAVIKGSAVNNDGSEKIGYTAPSIVGQTKIIAEAQAVAGVEPDSIRFIEAHGTATPLGDPIEVAALTRAFRLQTDKKNFCGLGSVKTNIGHMGVAAGAASIVKAALALKHKVIPESLHFESPNPKLDLANSPFYVVDKLERILPGPHPARAGVSSLGIGGTNAHVILEEPPQVDSSDSRAWQLLLLSAKTQSALDSMTSNLSTYMKNATDVATAEVIGDVAYTLQVGRTPFAFRRALVVPSDALPQLADSIAPGKGVSAKVPEKSKKIVFMFPGGGTQYVNMARDLYASEPAFAASMDACAVIFQRKMRMDIIGLMHPDAGQSDANTISLQRPKNFFAALFAVEYSLAQLWISWGVKPDALIGHSMGEYVAACIAEVFTLEDAIHLICCRGELFEKLEKGCMLSVTAPAAEVQALLIDGVSLATINDPGRCSVAGRPEPIAAFEKILDAKEIEYRKLLIDAAGHSPMIDPILEEFGRFLSTIKFNKPTLPFISNLSGDWVDAGEICTPAYWKKHLRQTVRFADGVATLLQEPNSIFLEVGPGNALCSFVRTQLEAGSPAVLLNSLRHVKEEKDDLCHFLETMGKLWTAGVMIDWQAFYADEQRKRIALPTYPFERKRYWVEPSRGGAGGAGAASAKLKVADWLWQASWRLDDQVPLAAASGAGAAGGNYLVLADNQGYVAGVVQALRGQGTRVVNVTAAATFTEIDDSNFQIDASDPKQYVQLFARLMQVNVVPATIVHAWSLSHAENAQAETINSQTSFVHLTQALAAHNLVDTLTLLGITNQREAVLASDQVNCMQSLIAGPEKVIPFEFPQIRFISLDLKLRAEDAAAKAGCAMLVVNELAVLTQQPGGSTSIALRNGLRFLKDHVPLATDDNAANPNNPHIGIRPHGVYLITGGLGGVGMAHAQAFAAFKTRLVLLQRGRFPQEAEWGALLADPGTSALRKEQIQGIRNLQAMGAEVLIVQADVTDAAQVAEALAEVRQRYGQINGLVHCAGYGEFVEIKKTSAEIIAAVLAPKVDGTRNLLQALANEDLDLVLLCSSMSVQTTGYGLVGYVSACAYLDAVAQAHKHDGKQNQKTRYLSINWDVWSTPQQFIKAQDDAVLSQKLKENKTAILPREGIEVIYRALASGQAQAVVSTVDFQQLLRKNKLMSEALLVDAEDEELAPDMHAGGLSLYERPSLSTEYVAPSTEQEKLLALIWQETLGISKIGVNDNFFELGGESLLGVKIVVKAKKQGLFFEPKQMFSTPTIAQIVQGLSSSSALTVDQAQVSGDAVCTPVQQQFLQTDWANRNHWNVGALLQLGAIKLKQEPSQELNQDSLQALATRLFAQHDGLRARYSQDAGGAWRQHYMDNTDNTDKTGAASSTCIDLSASSGAEFSARLQQHCARLQASFDVAAGPIAMLVFFKAALPEQNLLAILVHHLATDAVSLGILMEDLHALLSGADALPPKTTSYKDFSLALQSRIKSSSLQQDIDYWHTKAETLDLAVARLPQDTAAAENREQDAQSLNLVLDTERTRQLTQDTVRHSQLKLNELLVAALARTLCDWQQQPTILLDLVHHGRADLEGLDLSRTVGWFGAGCPCPLTLTDAPLASQLAAIKAQIDAVPQQGLSLAWLQTLHPDGGLRARLNQLPNAAVSLNYIGQIDQLASGALPVSRAESIGALRDPANQRSYQHEIVAFVQDGQLTLSWTYATTQYHAQTVQALLDSVARHLQQLIDTDWHKVFASGAQSAISEQTLARIGLTSDQVEDYYPLSPFQSEMYRLWSDAARVPSNVTQALSVLEGPLDKNLLQAAWQALVARHKVLRTRFMSDAQGAPLQVVCKQAAFSLIELDYSHLDAAAQQQAMQALMVSDRQTRYDLTQAPAMRLYWITLDLQAGRFGILSSNHQIILDGWTSSLLSRDLMGCLMAIATGAAMPPLELVNEYGDFIDWIGRHTQQNGDVTRAYWRTTLAGYRLVDPLQSILSSTPLPGADTYADLELGIDEALLANIQECARVTQTTGNAVFQAAWALTLAQLSGSQDIVYGITVSGRSCDLDGITEIVGQCTNTLPVRIPVTGDMRVAQLLQSVHLANAQTQAHNTISLREIADLLVGEGDEKLRPLYSSNFIFENIPRASGDEGAMPIKALSAVWVDGWQFPLRVFVVPEEKTWVRFAYDQSRMARSDVEQLAQSFHTNLIAIVSGAEAAVARLSNKVPHVPAN